jgi:ribosomal protein S18 acetylase RimI-like enzyme
MTSVNEIQAYLRASARQRYEAVALPPFTAFFHPFDTFRFFNYAIPDEPIQGDVQGSLTVLVAEFLERGRLPRFEFIESFAPALVGELRKARFVEEGRQQLMVCTPDTLKAARTVEGLAITQLASDSSLADGVDFLTAQRQGFEPAYTDRASEEEAQRFLQGTHDLVSFLGRVNEQPAAVASYTLPQNGIIEIAGVATVAPLRRRGIGTALTAAAVEHAFAHGATIACLTAGDAKAGRVYERIGFRPYATMLSYYLPAE